MPDRDLVQARVRELAGRDWDLASIEGRYRRLLAEGIPSRRIAPDTLLAHRGEVLDRIQQRAEEYEYLTHSCARGAALPVMEEFGLGSMAMLKGLSPFPGFGVTGSVCGAVSGGLFVLGLYFGSDDPTNYRATGVAVTAARNFIPRFEAALGSTLCPKIQEDMIFGRYMDARASRENFEIFQRELGYAKCALPAGVGARLAADIILGSQKATPPAVG